MRNSVVGVFKAGSVAEGLGLVGTAAHWQDAISGAYQDF